MLKLQATGNLIELLLCCRYSPFLMACYNPETEDFQSVCRVMSGFSDVFYTEVIGFDSLMHAFCCKADGKLCMDSHICEIPSALKLFVLNILLRLV